MEILINDTRDNEEVKAPDSSFSEEKFTMTLNYHVENCSNLEICLC